MVVPMTTRSALILIAALFALSVHAQVVERPPGVSGNDPLPEGSAKVLVQEKCTICHDLRRVVNSNYSPAEWQNVVNMMMAAGAPINQGEANQIRDYLTASFPGKPRPKPVVIDGPDRVEFLAWNVPTPGSRPHDPLAMPDGSIWWSGQFANKLGRLDPQTGELKEYPLPTHAGPHGLINDKDGDIWYAGNFGGHIGKLDPNTGEVKIYKLPDPKARDPHTPLFDKNGILWFSVQNGGFMGRLDPKTGDIKLVTPAGAPGQQPYALRFLSDGVTPWFSYFGSNKLAKVDPVTMEVKEYVLPDSRTRVRRMGVTSDDMIWFGDWSNGRLSRFDPRTGEVKSWQGPGGQAAQPYGFTVINDVIWYVESNLRPNTLVRFDPKTEKFQSWIIPSGGGIVRHMMPTPDGNIAMAMSGLNKIGMVVLR
jgi:virginiamycin B lyase